MEWDGSAPQAQVYSRIARNLREFGYKAATSEMVQEIHEAMKSNSALPHGVVGMFAKRQLDELTAVS